MGAKRTLARLCGAKQQAAAEEAGEARGGDNPAFALSSLSSYKHTPNRPTPGKEEVVHTEVQDNPNGPQKAVMVSWCLPGCAASDAQAAQGTASLAEGHCQDPKSAVRCRRGASTRRILTVGFGVSRRGPETVDAPNPALIETY